MFDFSRFSADKLTVEVVIVGTDYANYAVIFACGGIQNVGIVEAAWVLSRKRTLSSSYIQTATNLLKSQNLIAQNVTLTAVGQQNCMN